MTIWAAVTNVILSEIWKVTTGLRSVALLKALKMFIKWRNKIERFKKVQESLSIEILSWRVLAFNFVDFW